MKNILILKEKAIVIALDEKKKLVYFYHYFDKEIEYESKSILITIDSPTIQEINKHFNVDAQEYGVVVDDTPRREISKEDKKKITNEDIFTKYLMIFFFFVTLVMLNADTFHIENVGNGQDALGYIVLFVISLMLILIAGKELELKDKLTIKLKYNITTKPLPTKEEQIEILESKIDILLQQKKETP